VPGNEGAGVVIEDPSERFSAGERVLVFAGPGGVAEDGTFAEMTSVPSGNLAPLPGEIPDEIAGGLPERVSGASPGGLSRRAIGAGARRRRKRRERDP
jgi:NADPH:quinone reductase-like Zn-dependent oxidoreductase